MFGILAWQGKGSEPDPRFMPLQQFGVKHPETANDPVFKYVDQLYRVAPGVLTEHGKTKSAFAFVVERC
jgi:citrate synthase